MAEKQEERIEVVKEFRVRHVGILDLKYFYRDVKRWLDHNGYDSPFNEDKYDVQEFPDGAKTINIFWSAVKKKTKYFHYLIKIKWILVGVREIEIEYEGKKSKRFKGDFDIKIGSSIIKKGPQGSIRKIWERFVNPKRIDDHILDLYNKTNELREWMKNYFDQYI